LNIQSVDDAGNVTQDGEEDVDEEVSAAAALEEHSDWGNEDGEDDLDDVAVEEEMLATAVVVLWWFCHPRRFHSSPRNGVSVKETKLNGIADLPSGERHVGGSVSS
jgi:hypothetical protein